MTDQEIEKLSTAIAEKLAKVLRPPDPVMVRGKPFEVELEPLIRMLEVAPVVKRKVGWPKGKKRGPRR